MPELDGRIVRARCVRVNPHFSHRFGREEIHLHWELLEGDHAGSVLWMKLNHPNPIALGSYFYKWYVACFEEPWEGEPMSYTRFQDVAARVQVRTTTPTKPKGARPYSIIDPGVLPEEITTPEDPNPFP